jgi:o-succinylbenzoate synthase
MRIERADVLTYRGAVTGARGAATAWTEREGLLLRLVGADGKVGQGEASPLPGYSRDTIEEARTALRAVDWASVAEYEPGESVMGWLGRIVTGTPLLGGAARFAAETALLDLLGQRLGQPLWTLLRRSGEEPDVRAVPLCALVGGADDPRALPAVVAAVARGVHTVKLKIVGPSLDSQWETLAAARDAIAMTPLRLDANGTLSPATAREELSSLLPLRPEFVEEPVPTAALGALARSPVPIALDESLQEPGAWETFESRLAELHCVALVLKPMALGGVGACLDLGARAAARGLDVTVSHLFDGPIALAAAAHLALAMASRSRASGLDRHGGLGAWPTVNVPHIGPTTVLVGERPGLGVAPLPEPE